MSKKRAPRAMGLATAAVLAGLACSPDALALALGRVVVHSALGDPLRAEIEIPQISAEESASLQVGLGSPEAFQAAGLDYNPALASVQVSLQRHADGRHYLRLTSSRPMLEPFLDVVISTQWSSGRLVRDYTLLLDPPPARQAAAPATLQSQLPAAPATPAAPPAAAPAERAPVTRSTARPPASTPPPPGVASEGATLRVQPGDTAGRLAAAHKPAQVSLDQMLVALLRANPQAFIGGNVNRMRAGAVLTLPSEEQAAAVPAGEARRTVIAQSSDFNALRRKLAERAPDMQTASPTRQATGGLSAQLEDKQAGAAAADKLTLSKGQVQGKAAPEAKLAQAREAQASSERLAELSRNVNELARLESASGAPATAASAPVAGGLGTTLPGATAGASAPAQVASAALAAAMAASSPAPAASRPAPAASAAAPQPRPAAKPPAPPPEPSFVDTLLENPLIPAAAGGLLALLAGLGLYRVRQRKKSAAVDSSFFESQQPADSFFGASGGQQVDTRETGARAGSSTMYSASQLDAADVDPVAEADVYLAYGRDLQAEEILREAMRADPTRVALHAKLLEIHAKRRDPKAFEALALETHQLSSGSGPEWQRICELGRDLDPGNALYQPGGQPSAEPRTGAAADRASALFTPDTIPQAGASPAPANLPVDLDLDLDLDLDFASTQSPDEPAMPAIQAAPPRAAPPPERPPRLEVPPAPPPAPAQPAAADMGLDFVVPSLTPAEPSAATPAAAPDLLPELDLDLPAAPPAAAPAPAANMIEFDLDALSLDLPPPVPDAATEASEDDPLATKLALAQEFHAIGDTDGARTLVKEVVAEASGSLKSRAERFLAELA